MSGLNTNIEKGSLLFDGVNIYIFDGTFEQDGILKVSCHTVDGSPRVYAATGQELWIVPEENRQAVLDAYEATRKAKAKLDALLSKFAKV